MAVLLEEEPLENLRPQDAIIGQEARVLRQVPLDGVRFGEAGSVLQLEEGDPTVRIERQVLGGAGLAAQDVVLDPLEGQLELAQQQPHLVAVSGLQVVVQAKHRGLLGARFVILIAAR